MGWFLRYQKYNKLTKELIYYKSELEYCLTLTKEVHWEFEEYQKEFCLKRDINLAELKERHLERIKRASEGGSSVMGNLSREAIAEVEKKSKEEKIEARRFSHLYKRIAKKIHPDKLVNLSDKKEFEEREALFKKASEAYVSHDWASLLEVANILNIKPTFSTLASVCGEISKSIEILKVKISEEEKRYGYLYANCETEECKENLMKRMLHQFFGILI